MAFLSSHGNLLFLEQVHVLASSDAKVGVPPAASLLMLEGDVYYLGFSASAPAALILVCQVPIQTKGFRRSCLLFLSCELLSRCLTLCAPGDTQRAPV